MNWCLILNVFQTLPKKSTNSISFMHSFPLPWVFLQKHKVFYNHTQINPAMIFQHFSTFFSPCSSCKVQCYPPISGCSGPSLLSQSHVCGTGTLLWSFAEGRKAIRWSIFLAPSFYVLLGLGRPHGIAVLASGRGQPRRIGGWQLCNTEEVWARLRDKLDTSNIIVASSPPNWGQCHIMHFYNSDVPRAPVHRPRDARSYYTTTNSLGFKSSSELSFLFSIPPFPLKQRY